MADISKFSGLDKAAIVFQVLGHNLAMSIFKNLSEDEIMKIRAHMQKVNNIPFDVKRAVLEDFYFGFVANKFKPQKEETKKPFEFINKLTDEQIIYLLSSETPRVVAITLAQLSVERQVTLLQRLDAELQGEVLVEMGSLEDIPLEAVVNLAADLREKSHFLPTASEFSRGGGKNLAEILGRMDPKVGEQFIERLQKDSPELAKEIKKYHFTFDDLLMLPESKLSEVLRGAEVSDIAYALKGKSEDFKEKFIKALPEKTQIFLKDEMELLEGPQPKRKVIAAQKSIVDSAKKLEETDDSFNLADFVGDEEYIE